VVEVKVEADHTDLRLLRMALLLKEVKVVLLSIRKKITFTPRERVITIMEIRDSSGTSTTERVVLAEEEVTK